MSPKFKEVDKRQGNKHKQACWGRSEVVGVAHGMAGNIIAKMSADNADESEKDMMMLCCAGWALQKLMT